MEGLFCWFGFDQILKREREVRAAERAGKRGERERERER